jgi:nitronate monooxygenase
MPQPWCILGHVHGLFELPIIQAPMAGGPDTPELAAAVSEVGGLGSIGCGYLSPVQIAEVAGRVRALTARPFALNLFVRGEATTDPDAAPRVAPLLAGFRRELGLPAVPPAPPPVPRFEAQLEAVLAAAPAVVSFTFGIPTRDQLAALRGTGIMTIGTATTVVEADALVDAGVDAICAQGAEAGGHRGTFIGRFEDALIGTLPLVRQLVRRARLPVIAAGGIMDGRGMRAALDLGAVASQLGTAFMLCPEAGTTQAHRVALATATATTVTRAFSGRPARGIRNRFAEAFVAVEPAPFPEQQQLTYDLRRAAAAAGRTDLMQMWAGQGAPLVRSLAATDLVRALVAEAS